MTIYEHIEIMDAVRKGRGFNDLLNPLMMGSMRLSDKETVGFDKDSEDLRIAPLVHPDARGQIMSRQGFETLTFSPAYTKPKRVIRYRDLQDREIGYDVNEKRSNSVLYGAKLAEEARFLRDKILKLRAYMLSQLVKTGTVDVSSPDYGRYLLDFNRPANASKTATAAQAWSKVTDATPSSPVNLLEDFISGLDKPTQNVVFGDTAWKNYRQDPKFEKVMDRNYDQLSGTSSLEIGPIQMGEERNWRFVGRHTSLGVDMFVDKTVVKVGNTDVRLVDADSVACIPAPNYGVWGFGAIQDSKADFMSFPMFFKNYETDDPGLPWVQAHSAMVPFHKAIEGLGYYKTEA